MEPIGKPRLSKPATTRLKTGTKLGTLDAVFIAIYLRQSDLTNQLIEWYRNAVARVNQMIESGASRWCEQALELPHCLVYSLRMCGHGGQGDGGQSGDHERGDAIRVEPGVQAASLYPTPQQPAHGLVPDVIGLFQHPRQGAIPT